MTATAKNSGTFGVITAKGDTDTALSNKCSGGSRIAQILAFLWALQLMATRNRILKDANGGQMSDHLRSHIHLTNCIHLKNHMHKQSPMMADRSLMRDLLVLQRSRSLRDPSASPPSAPIVEGRRSLGVDNRRESRRLSGFSPPFSVGGAIMSDRSGESGNRGSRRNRREESHSKSNWDADDLVDDVVSRNSESKSRKSKQKGKYSQDFPIKTLLEQLNEVALDVDVAKRREFQGVGRIKATPSSRIGAYNEISVASSSMAQPSARPRHHLEEKEEEELGDHNMTRIPKNGCGIPFNWSRIHHRGKSLLGMAGRSLSHGLSDTKFSREQNMPLGSDYSVSSPKSDDEARLLNDLESSEHAGWVHDYSGELGLYADHLLTNNIDSDSDLASEARSGGQWKRSRHQNSTQKYMPKTFGDLVGQNLVAHALSNAVMRRKIGLLYVFYGPHGTGKTSCARIFARALNCLSLEHPKPCGHCISCIAYDKGKSPNVREVGPVSNFDFERIMDLLDNMIISQLPSQYRVFIFDDCESLSLDCWSALTKVIDRAPRRVVFILVSSSLDVLPHIVVSRCQKFFFPKLKDADIVYTLQWIASRELIDIDNDALKLIASRSDGSLRDAEMTLEQLGLLGLRISVTLVQELVGLVSDEKLVDLLDLALSADTVNTVKNLRVIMETGVEPLTLMSQLATVITDILAGTYDFTKERNRWKFFQRQPLSKERMEKLRQALKTLSEAEKQLRVSNDKLTWLTAALLQLAPETSFNQSPLALDNPNGTAISRKGKTLEAGTSEIVEMPSSPRKIGGDEENYPEFIRRGVMLRTSLGELEVSPKKSRKGSLWKRREVGVSESKNIVRSKVPLARVLQRAEQSSWSEQKAVSIAEKLEQENLRLEPRSRSLLCWKASRATHRKRSRSRIRTRRRSHPLLKLVSCGKCVSSRSPR